MHDLSTLPKTKDSPPVGGDFLEKKVRENDVLVWFGFLILTGIEPLETTDISQY